MNSPGHSSHTSRTSTSTRIRTSSRVSPQQNEVRPQLPQTPRRANSNSFDAARVVSGGNTTSPRGQSSTISSNSSKKSKWDINEVGQGPGLRPRIQPEPVGSPGTTYRPGEFPRVPAPETPEEPRTPRSVVPPRTETTVELETNTAAQTPGRIDTTQFRRNAESALVRVPKENKVETITKPVHQRSPRSLPKSHNLDELPKISSPVYFPPAPVPKGKQPKEGITASKSTAMIDAITQVSPKSEDDISDSESDTTCCDSDSEPETTLTSRNLKTRKKGLSKRQAKTEIHYCRCRCNMTFDETLDDMGITSRNERIARKTLYYGFRIMGLFLIWSAFARAEMLLRMAAYGSHGEFIFDEL